MKICISLLQRHAFNNLKMQALLQRRAQNCMRHVSWSPRQLAAYKNFSNFSEVLGVRRPRNDERVAQQCHNGPPLGRRARNVRPSRHVTSRHVTSRHVTSRHVTSRHVTSRHVTSRHVTSRHVTSARNVTSRHVTSRHVALITSARHVT